MGQNTQNLDPKTRGRCLRFLDRQVIKPSWIYNLSTANERGDHELSIGVLKSAIDQVFESPGPCQSLHPDQEYQDSGDESSEKRI